jgi:hypothetical protein
VERRSPVRISRLGEPGALGQQHAGTLHHAGGSGHEEVRLGAVLQAEIHDLLASGLGRPAQRPARKLASGAPLCDLSEQPVHDRPVARRPGDGVVGQGRRTEGSRHHNDPGVRSQQ